MQLFSNQISGNQILLAIPDEQRSRLSAALFAVDPGMQILEWQSSGELLDLVKERRAAVVVVHPDILPAALREYVQGPDYNHSDAQVFVLMPMELYGQAYNAEMELKYRAPLCLITHGSAEWNFLNLARQLAREVRQVCRARQSEERYAEAQSQIADLEDYAHTVAHNLKAPLNGITGLAQLMLQAGDTLSADECERYLGSIIRGGRRLDRVIEELLLLATVDRELQSPPRLILDMDVIVHEVEQSLEHQIQSSDAIIVTPQSWPVAVGYAPWVREVWINYIANALQYGGKPPIIQLGAEENESESMVRFWVRDNGDGIKATDQALLFSQRSIAGLRPNVRPSAGGHGLGLSIVRRIVEKLGGTVQVESAGLAGRGSCFSFTLPAIRTHELPSKIDGESALTKEHARDFRYSERQ